MVAAIQAPIILMSQNRHSVKDRLDAAHDYEVNLKARLEILDFTKRSMNCARVSGRTDPFAASRSGS